MPFLQKLRAAWAEHSSLLAASEALRVAQEMPAASPPAAGARAAPAAAPSLWAYFLGTWTRAEAAALAQELYAGTPRSALYAGVVVLLGCGCSLLKARSKGSVMDAMAGLAASGGGGAAGRDLWEWRAGWESLGSLALWTALEWACLVGKDIFLALARTQRSGQSRALYFASMLRQDQAFHAAHPSSELAARLASDSECLDGLCVHGPERFLQGLVSLATLAWLLAVDPLLLALALALRLPQLLQVTELSVRMAAAYERLADHKAQVAQARAADTLGSVRVVQAHGAEREEVAGYCAALGEHLRVVRASAVVRSLLRHSEGLVLLVTEVALLAFGAWRILAGAQTLGSFSARREYSNSLIENFHGLEHVYQMVRRCQLLLGRYLRLRNRVPAVPSTMPLPMPLPPALAGGLPASTLAEYELDVAREQAFYARQEQQQQQVGEQSGRRFLLQRGHALGTPSRASGGGSSGVDAAAPPLLAPPFSITFEDVTFHYPGASRAALSGASFHIPAGALCAFVGGSGGGKTTAGRLLQRCADPTSGRILLNGCDIRSVPTAALRQWVGGVDQDTVTALLARSVRDNICLGLAREGVDEAALAEAVQGAAAQDFVQALPQQLETLVRERGGTVSGGQRQRLCLARLLLRNPPVAVIDEGTSALDAFSEEAVLKAISQRGAVGTRIVIAHRLATVKEADLVVVFEDGRVVEVGSPAQLRSKAEGKFAALWALQTLNSH